MEEFAKVEQYANIMEALFAAEGVLPNSPFRTARQQLHRNLLAVGDRIPQVYDATNRYDSALLQQIFLKTFEEQQEIEITRQLDKSMVQTAQTFRPAIEHDIAPSSLEDLEQVCVVDVIQKVNHIHTGCVMLVEVVHVPYRQVGTMVLVRDSNNDIMMLALYNYVAPEENPKELFPVGKKLALLCPFLKNARDDKRLHLMLRCDNPQFAVSHDEDRYNIWKKYLPLEVIPSPSELKLMGNQHFQHGNLEEASKCYSKALAHVDIDNQAFASDKVSCWSNRAEVNLRLERWHEAAKDAQDVLKIRADHTKAKFRLVKAWSRIGKASDSLLLLEELKRSGSVRGRSSDIQELARDCRRIANEESGEYNVKSMMNEGSAKQPGERLSSFHATFCSPKVAIGVPIVIRGEKSYRGCKALMNLEEGELIMSSKAFATGRRRSEGVMMEVNAHERSLGDNARVEIVSQIVRKLWKTPSLGKEFYSLSDGDPSRPPIHDGTEGKIDLARIRDIVRSNSFNQNPYDEGIRQAWEKLDASQHRFVGDPHTSEQGGTDGLWINESMLNHSCTPNCTWFNIADQIFIRTTKPIQKGDELCISYYPTNGSYEKRADVFSRWIRPGLGFECVCDHCELLRSRDDLRQLANEVHDEMGEVEDIQRTCGTTRAMAGQEVFPLPRRRAIFSAFSRLPFRLQHARVAELHELEALIMATNDDLSGALETNLVAAKINYEVRGSGHWNYLVETWCIAGLALACKNFDLARESLAKIWNSPAFQAFPTKEAEVMFDDLTYRYITQQIPFDPQYLIQIKTLVQTVLKGIQ